MFSFLGKSVSSFPLPSSKCLTLEDIIESGVMEDIIVSFPPSHSGPIPPPTAREKENGQRGKDEGRDEGALEDGWEG